MQNMKKHVFLDNSNHMELLKRIFKNLLQHLVQMHILIMQSIELADE